MKAFADAIARGALPELVQVYFVFGWESGEHDGSEGSMQRAWNPMRVKAQV